MRINLFIEEPVLQALKEIAEPIARHGFVPFPATERGDPVTNEQVNRLRDAIGV